VLWCVGGALIVTGVVLFSGLGETYSAADLTRIVRAEAQLRAACRPPLAEQQASSAVATLIGYYLRDPGQSLPLHGAGNADSMRAELTNLRAFVSSGSCGRSSPLQATLDRALNRR
jgi:hypothetical protein